MTRRRPKPSERLAAAWREMCETGLEPHPTRRAAEAALLTHRIRQQRSGHPERDLIARHCNHCPNFHLLTPQRERRAS